jgi:flagellar hook-associated protein FlgK
MLNTLNVAQSGLNAARIAVENVSNNIANENTPGYKKRVVQLDELSQLDNQFTGRGVNATDTYRITSQYTYDKLISENTKSNYYAKLSGMMSNVESIFSETIDSGLSADLNRYYQSIEDLRTNPNSQSYKTSLQNQGTILVESLQNLYTSVEKQQQVEKKELYANVDEVNNILKDIGTINEKIERFGKSNDLLDKRDQLESNLSNYVDISVSREDNSYELKIAGQSAVTNTNVRKIEINEEETLQKDKYTLLDNNVKPPVVYDSIKYNDDLSAKKFNANDVVTYKLNNEFSVSVTIGESITMDWNGDGIESTQKVDSSNLTRALVHKINSNANMKDSITAYNGDYSIDENGNKITKNSQDNYLRIESLNGGLANDFQGRVYVEQYPTVTYSTYFPQKGDIISLDNVVNNSELSKALADSSKFVNNGNGTYTATSNAGKVRLVDGEAIKKTFVGGETITASTLQPGSDFTKALADSSKFLNNGDGTYTATALAGTLKLNMNESITIDTPIALSFSVGDLIDINGANINPGSTLATYLADSSIFQELSPGSGIYKAIVPSDGSVNDSFGNPVNDISLEKGESISKLKVDVLNVGVANIPAGSIIKADNLITNSSLYTLLNDPTKFDNNADGTFTVKLSNGPIANTDFKLTGSENISISLSQKISLSNDFSYTPPSSYDSSMISNMELDGTPVVWDNVNGVVTDGSGTQIGLTKDATLTFDVTGTTAGNKVDLKAGDIIEITNEDSTNGLALSEGILESQDYFPLGNGKYQLNKDKTLTFDDALDSIKVTRNLNPVTPLEMKSQIGPGSDKIERVDVTTAVNFDETVSSKLPVRDTVFKNESESKEAESKVSIRINDRDITLKGGILKAQVDNLSSDSLNNKFQVYLDKLDSFAQTLSDVSDKYIKNDSGSYVYGDIASDESSGTINSINLFSGSSVKTLKFNGNMVNDLTQDKLDYLASLQWKDNLSFDGKGQNENSTNKSTLSDFFKDIRVNVSSDKENVASANKTQENITVSIKSTYDQLTKVDKDEEMLNLIKFQSAYTANAKMITTIDEMLQTLLGMKR